MDTGETHQLGADNPRGGKTDKGRKCDMTQEDITQYSNYDRPCNLGQLCSLIVCI